MAIASAVYSPLRLKTRPGPFFPAHDAVSPMHSPITQGPGKRANLIVRSRADAPHLKKAALAIEQAAWSNLGYLSYTGHITSTMPSSSMRIQSSNSASSTKRPTIRRHGEIGTQTAIEFEIINNPGRGILNLE